MLAGTSFLSRLRAPTFLKTVDRWSLKDKLPSLGVFYCTCTLSTVAVSCSLIGRLKKNFGLILCTRNTTKPHKIIKLLLTRRNSTQEWSAITRESYHLQVDDGKQTITITGQQPVGVFYGVQTLLAVIEGTCEVARMSVKDSPRFSYRGLMIDVGRNFMPKKDILKLLDAMAMFKMNKLHFHLTENEGWRLEIPGIKELTEVCASFVH